MRNNYEYEIGFRSGISEALRKQNEKMREKIIAQSQIISQVIS